MSSAPIPATDNQTLQKPKRLIPPEPKFWKRYSPHHEFSLSSAASIALHALAFGLLILIGVLAANLGWLGGSDPLPVFTLDEGALAGGGGDPGGQGEGPADAPPSAREAAVAKAVEPPRTGPETDETLKDAVVDPLDLPELNPPEGQRILDLSDEAVKRLKGIEEDTRKKLFRGLAQRGKGEGGPGEGGGLGKGKGKGIGNQEGDAKGKLNRRQKRVLRWVMMFNTVDGDDYRKQLLELGAILAVPQPGGGYAVIRDLRKLPAQGKREDLDKIKRIFWVDDKPDSVASLSKALGLRLPPHIVAFFPESLEKELLQKELAFRNRQEDDIRETRFRVERRGGKYEPIVDSQL